MFVEGHTEVNEKGNAGGIDHESMIFLLIGQLYLLAPLLTLLLHMRHNEVKHIAGQMRVFLGLLRLLGLLGKDSFAIFEVLNAVGFDEGGKVELERLGELFQVFVELSVLAFELIEIEVDGVDVLKVVAVLGSFSIPAQLSDAICVVGGVLLLLAIFWTSMMRVEL